jgi:ABC-type Fe3+-hydroxamate transport system substrate-binding protein
VGGPVAGLYPGIVRLVSLLPSATEIVYALGLGDDLAGVTFECDEPPAARAEKAIVVGGIVVRPGPRLVNGVEALASIFHSRAVPAAPPGAVRRVS